MSLHRLRLNTMVIIPNDKRLNNTHKQSRPEKQIGPLREAAYQSQTAALIPKDVSK
jgi:hypothetical protein